MYEETSNAYKGPCMRRFAFVSVPRNYELNSLFPCFLLHFPVGSQFVNCMNWCVPYKLSAHNIVYSLIFTVNQSKIKAVEILIALLIFLSMAPYKPTQ